MDQGLIATIIPKFDMSALSELASQLKSTMSDAVSSVNFSSSSDNNSVTEMKNAVDNATTAINTMTEAVSNSSGTGTGASDVKKVTEEQIETISKSDSLTKIWGKLTDLFKGVFSEDKFGTMSLSDMTKGMGGMLKESLPYVAIISSVITMLFKLVEGVIDRLRASAPMLSSIISLIENTFSLVFMPLGIALTQKLIPMLVDVYNIISDWFTEVWNIYEEQGLVGIIIGTFETLMNLFKVVFRDSFNLFVDIIVESIVGVGVMVINSLAKMFGIDFHVDFNSLMEVVRKFVDLFVIVGDWFIEVGFEAIKRILEVLFFIVEGPFATIITILNSVMGYVLDMLEWIDWDTFGDFLVKSLEFFRDLLAFFVSLNLELIFGMIVNIYNAIVGMFNPDGTINFTGLSDRITDQMKNFLESIGLGGIGDFIQTTMRFIERFISDVSTISIPALLNKIVRLVDVLLDFFNVDIVDSINSIGSTPIGDRGLGLDDVAHVVLPWTNIVSAAVGNDPLETINTIGRILGIGSAEGGVFNKPTLRVIGEAGPEAVVPLDKYNGGSKTEIVNNWYISGVSDEKLIAKIRKEVSSISSLAKTRVGF